MSESYPIANPGEYSGPKSGRATGLFLMWFGAYGDTKILVWADSFEDAFEEAVDYLDDPSTCGIFTFLTEADFKQAREELIDEGNADPSDDDVFEHVTVDMTIIGHTTIRCGEGMAVIPSWEWGGDDVPRSSELYQYAVARSGMRTISVTYDIVTPESAEQGDTAEDGHLEDVDIDSDDLDEDETMAQRAAKLIYESGGSVIPDRTSGAATSFYEADGREDFKTGDVERRAYHVGEGEGWAEFEQREITELLTRKRGGMRGLAGSSGGAGVNGLAGLQRLFGFKG